MRYNKNQLQGLNKLIEEKIDGILGHFAVKVNRLQGRYNGRCPVHSGDSPTAFSYNLNINKNWNYKTWRCFTNNCHRIFADNTIGLVRGLLSNQNNNWRGIGDDIYKFSDTLTWIENFLGIKNTDTLVQCKNEHAGQEIREFVMPPATLELTRQQIRDMMGRRSKYFLERGFKADLLDEFDVGSPLKPIPKYYFREFVPVYDSTDKYCIGAIARSIFEKCKKCGGFHDAAYSCPKEEFVQFYCKWKAWEFNRAYSLYNLGRATPYIQKENAVILVEGTGSIWKFREAGINNVVASYGTNLSYGQKELLKRTGADYLYLAFDNDKAGDNATKVLGKELWPFFYLRKFEFPKMFNDIGEINNPGYLNKITTDQLRIK